MSRGLGRRQREVLADLHSEQRFVERIGVARNETGIIDPETGQVWIRASILGILDTDEGALGRPFRADQASVRRSARSLNARGLVETRMMDMPTEQRDSEKYGVRHIVVRNVLMVRLTAAGLKYFPEE